MNAMQRWLLVQILSGLTPVLVGALTPIVQRWLKQVATTTGDWPPMAQRAVTLVLASLGTLIATFLQVEVTGDPTAWNNGEMNTVLAAAISYAIHAADKGKQRAVQEAAAKAHAAELRGRGEHPFAIPPATDESAHGDTAHSDRE